MKFSIATPVLNGMPAGRRCVGSVRNQMYGAWEHLVQDGGSTDGTAEWLGRQNGLSAISAADCGMYDAVNRAWTRSDGDILSWLNADEQYLPHTLETVRTIFENEPAVDAVFGDYIVVDGDGNPVAARKEIPLRAWYAKNCTLYVMSCTLFVRRRVWERFGGFDTSFRIVGDKDWLMRLLAGRVRFRHVRSFLSLFSISGGNLSLQPEAAAESRRIRERYGAYGSARIRALPRCCRYMEKALAGCYGQHRVEYDYATDEVPTLMHVAATVSSKWSWGPATGADPETAE